MVHADLASTLAARLASLQHELTPAQAAEIATCAGGTSLGTLTADLLASLDPDLNAAKAKALFSLPEYEEPTERQLDEAERQSLAAALKPFHDPTLREAIIAAKAMAEQIIDEVTQDSLLSAGHDAKARDRARSVLTDFRAFLEAHRDEIAAVKLLYSQPYRSGLRYSQVKDLARKLARPPFNVSPDRAPYAETLWKAFELAEPERVRAHGGKALVDLVALVRHALHPEAALLPVAIDIEQRYTAWLQEKEQAGGSFTPEQRRWLGVIKDHVATSLRIEPDDFEYAPFSQLGGLGKAHEVFGADLAGVLEELNRVLAA
jgi:type I restriction enzyme R subunit